MDEDRLTIQKREQLVADSEAHKDAIRNQVIELKSSAERWMKTVLVIGGTIVIAYSFVRALIDQRGSKSNPDLPVKTNHGANLGIFNSVMQQIAFFLMAMAREKLMEFLNNYSKGEADTPASEE